jgi:hypothetical protein
MSEGKLFITVFGIIILFGLYLANFIVYFAQTGTTLCTKNHGSLTIFANITGVRNYQPLLYDCNPSHACELSIAWTTTNNAWWTLWTSFPKTRRHEAKLRSACCDADGTPRTQPYIEGCYHDMSPHIFHHFSDYKRYDWYSTSLFLSRMCRSILYLPVFVTTAVAVFITASMACEFAGTSYRYFRFRRAKRLTERSD